MWHITLISAWVRSQPEHCTCRYALYQPLNVLWQAYAGKLLQSPTLEDLLQVRIRNEGWHSEGQCMLCMTCCLPYSRLHLVRRRNNTPAQQGGCTLQADLHGCQLTVLDSKIRRHIGKQGIVVQVRNMSLSVLLGSRVRGRQISEHILMILLPCQDRGNVLVVITPDNQQLSLAKRGGKFRVQLDALHAMDLSGDALLRQVEGSQPR